MPNYNELTSKAARTAHIKHMLATNAQWALRGLLRIYEHQTEDEKASQSTHHDNGIGFNGADAEILTSLAHQVKAGRNMSEKQMALIHKKMPKYARQLEGISNK